MWTRQKINHRRASVEECLTRNGEAVRQRIDELVESAQKNDGSYNIEQARSLGNIEGRTGLICDLLQRYVIPTIHDHEGRITTNKWRIRGVIIFCVAISGGVWWLGTKLFEMAFQ